MASALNSGGIGWVSRHKEQTWVPAERPGTSKPPAMAAYSTTTTTTPGCHRQELSWYHGASKFSLCRRSFQKNNLQLSVRVCCRAILKDDVSTTPASEVSPVFESRQVVINVFRTKAVASSLEDRGHVSDQVDWSAFLTKTEDGDGLKVKVVEKKKRKVKKKVQEHVGRSLEAIGVRNASLAKCVIQGIGMTEQEMLEWMNMLHRLGVAHAEIVSLVGKDASVLRAHIPNVELLFSYLKLELNLDRGTIASMCMTWPGLLLCPVQHVQDVTGYFVSVGLKSSDVTGVLTRRPNVLSHSVERIQYSIQCLLESGVLIDDLVPILKKVPELFSDLTQKNLDSKLEFLLKVGLGSGALGKAIARRPNILNYSLDSMRVAFKYLTTLMVTRDVPKLVKRYAEVLVLDPQRKMAPMVDYLISLGVPREKIGKVILRRPQLLGYTIPGLQSTIQYLIELGVKPEFLGKVISTSPQVLTLNVEEKLKPVVEFFRSMGLNKERDIEMLLIRNAQILCCSIEKNLRPKFIYFKGIGLTEKSIANMIVLFPSMLGQSIEGSLAPKFNYLVYEMKRPIEEIVQFPQYFGYSLEKRIKPRHELLKDKSISTSLASMLACVDDDFKARYLSGPPPNRAPYTKRVKETDE